MTDIKTCSRCGGAIPPPAPGAISTGYGTNEKDEIVCYSCCAEIDKQWMRDKGKITLYLTGQAGAREVTNWPGTLRFPARGYKQSPHNIARYRYDVWFNGPDGHVWHGVQYGDNTQLIHCKRTKEQTK